MKKIYSTIFLLLLVLLPLSCEKEEITIEEFDLLSELQEGAWRFQKVVNNENETIIDGSGEPTMLFFFLEDYRFRGRLAGNYSLEEDILSIQASIVDSVLVLWAEYDKLSGFPSRYYELETVFQSTPSGTVEYFENGWDSEFSFQFSENLTMWFERY